MVNIRKVKHLLKPQRKKVRVSKTMDTHSNTHMFAFKFLQHSDNSLSLEYVSFFLIQKQMMGS